MYWHTFAKKAVCMYLILEHGRQFHHKLQHIFLYLWVTKEIVSLLFGVGQTLSVGMQGADDPFFHSVHLDLFSQHTGCHSSLPLRRCWTGHYVAWKGKRPMSWFWRKKKKKSSFFLEACGDMQRSKHWECWPCVTHAPRASLKLSEAKGKEWIAADRCCRGHPKRVKCHSKCWLHSSNGEYKGNWGHVTTSSANH